MTYRCQHGECSNAANALSPSEEGGVIRVCIEHALTRALSERAEG